MFIDWLSISQEYDHDLPQVCDVFSVVIDAHTGAEISRRHPRFKHEGSFSTVLTVHVSGRKVTVEGNPSRYGRPDNLIGFKTIQQCVSVYNAVLAEYGLPPFTKCTKVWLRDGESGARSSHWVADGARLHRVDVTTNFAVGKNNVDAYLRALSSQRIGRNPGYLYPNGKTVVWNPSGGEKSGRLMYRKAYDKAAEMQLNLLPSVKRKFGENSAEYKYVQRVHQVCVEQGIVRFEQEFKKEFLDRKAMCFWGLFDESSFEELHSEFLGVDKKLEVTAMDLVSIADVLISEGVVKSKQAANATALVWTTWMDGRAIGLSNRQFETHAARLNRIGIDIRRAPDVTTSSPVIVKQVREITKTSIVIPAFYSMPNHLRVAA